MKSRPGRNYVDQYFEKISIRMRTNVGHNLKENFKVRLTEDISF